MYSISHLSRTILLSFVFLYTAFSFNTVYASNNKDGAHYQTKLDELRANITKVQQHLTNNKKQRNEIAAKLKTLEFEISNNSKRLNKLKKDLQEVHKQKNTLEAELSKLNKQVNTQKNALSEQMRSAYSLGQQKQIKVLLNQQDTSQIGRTQIYLNYINSARTEQINHFMQIIEQKQQVESKHKHTLNTLERLVKEQKIKTRARKKQRLQRMTLLTKLGHEIKNQESTLNNLEESRNKIEILLKSLGELLADIPTSPSENKPFSSLKGHYPWPVKGQFLGKFGQAKSQGNLKWNGVLIKSKHGTPVRVISHGRVAFSDWLQGFGFIIIVDHGNGYMSLYGHNETLIKQMGDWVSSGEIISTAGDSGGQLRSGVYFEIRSNGKPVNPSKWCASSATHTNLLK